MEVRGFGEFFIIQGKRVSLGYDDFLLLKETKVDVFQLRPSLRFWNEQVLLRSLSTLFGTLVFLPRSVFLHGKHLMVNPLPWTS